MLFKPQRIIFPVNASFDCSCNNNRISPVDRHENIYYDESILEVNFNVTNDENEHVNIIILDQNGKRTLEFFKRNSVTKERVEWAAPKQVALAGMVKIFDMARNI
jgi:hypothetical protein